MRVPGDDREIRIDSVRAQMIEIGLALGDGYVDVLRPVQQEAALNLRISSALRSMRLFVSMVLASSLMVVRS